MAIKNIYDTEISAVSFTWNGNTIATQAWVNANVSTPTLDAVTTAGNVTTNNIGVGLIELSGDTEHRLYRATTSLVKGTTTDTTILTGRTLDLYAYDDVNIRAGSSDNISFTAGGVSNAMYINSSGNVGIGLTNPTRRLDVNGKVRARSWFTGADDTNTLWSSTALGTYLQAAASTGTGSEIAFRRADGLVRMLIDTEAGNVGVGVVPKTGGSTWQHIQFGGTGNIISRKSDSTVDAMFANNYYINSSNADSHITTGAATRMFLNDGEIRFDTAPSAAADAAATFTNRMFIANGGNVGIGTTSPGAKLEIESGVPGSIKLGDISNYNGISLNGTLDIQNYNLLSRSTDKALYINRPSGNDIFFREDNTDTQLIIKSGGNVGIGTTSPGSAFKLDVNGYIKANSRIYVRDSTKTLEFGTDYIQSYVTSGTAVNPIRFFTGSTEKARIDGNGNVGIGTTSPSSELHVDGVMTLEGGIRSNPSGVNEAVVIDYQLSGISLGRLRSRDWDNGVWKDFIIQANDITLDADGAIDLQTSALTWNSNTLATQSWVTGQGYLTSFSETDTLATVVARGAYFGTTNQGYVASGGTYGTELRKIRRITLTAGASNWDGDNHAILSENISGATTDSISINSYNGIHLRLDSNNNQANNLTNFTIHNNTTTNTNELFRVTGDGNVGIGTTSPAAKLHIHHTSEEVLRIDSGNTGTIHFFENTTRRGILGYSNGTSIATAADAGDMVLRAESGSKLHLAIAGTSRLTVSGSNIGIGTTSPSYALDIERATGEVAIQLQARDNTSNTAIYFGDNSDADVGSLIYNQGSNYMSFTTNAGERMRITSAGNVGIGTTSPSQKLEVSKNGNASNGIRISNTTNDTGARSALELINDSGGFYLYAASTAYNGVTGWGDSGIINSSSALQGGIKYNSNYSGSTGGHYFQTGTVTRVRIDGSGNVGIGTTSPTAPLHVIGTVRMGDTSDGLTFTSGSGIGNIIGVDTGFAGYNAVAIKASANTGIYLDTADNVGIGTTSPAYKLDVNGSMHSTNITIADAIYHEGDTNTYIRFNTDTIELITGGGIRTTINNNGVKFGGNTIIAGGSTLSLGERAEADDNGRTVLIEGVANAGNGEGSGRIFFSEHNSTTAGAESYGLSLYYEGDPNATLPSGFQPNTGNATWSLRRHDNSVNGAAIMSGFRTSSNVDIHGRIYLAANNSYIAFNTSASSGAPRIQMGSDGDFSFLNTAGSTNLHIENGGNVGIGTTSPSRKLHVSTGNTDIAARFENTSNNSTVMELLTSGDGKTMYFQTDHIYVSSGSMHFGNNTGDLYLKPSTSGGVGIGTTSPSEKLEVDGNILASGDITAFSDARLKENVKTLPNALESVKAMRGVTYNKIGEEKQSIGVIAQEVQAVLPQLVSEHKDEMLSVAYGNITAVLIEAIKEQQKQIDELKAQLDGLTK